MINENSLHHLCPTSPPLTSENTHGPRRNATFSGFKIWLFPTSRDIFWGHRDCSQVNQNRKISVLSKLDKEKQMALKHEFSALNYNLYYPRTKKWGTGIVLDPRTTNQLPFPTCSSKVRKQKGICTLKDKLTPHFFNQVSQPVLPYHPLH